MARDTERWRVLGAGAQLEKGGLAQTSISEVCDVPEGQVR
jgi:hypothetical protein